MDVVTCLTADTAFFCSNCWNWFGMIVPSIKSYGYLSLPDVSLRGSAWNFHINTNLEFSQNQRVSMLGFTPPNDDWDFPKVIRGREQISGHFRHAWRSGTSKGADATDKSPANGAPSDFEEIKRCNTEKICRLYRSKLSFCAFKKEFRLFVC